MAASAGARGRINTEYSDGLLILSVPTTKSVKRGLSAITARYDQPLLIRLSSRRSVRRRNRKHCDTPPVSLLKALADNHRDGVGHPPMPLSKKPASGGPFPGAGFLNARPAPKMEKAIDRFLTILMAVSAAAFTAVTLAYIARYDLGFSREEIRTFAVVAASVAVALVVIEFFGKKLRKLK
jgi:hypothetical protein